MKLSPIQLEGYALIDLAYRANQDHRPGQPTAYGEEDILATTTLERDAADQHRWSVVLKFQLQPRPSANGPYHIALHLAGVIRTAPDFSVDDLETVVRVSGASVLYGIAREIVRHITSTGPFLPVLIPTVSFRPEPKSDQRPQEIAAGAPK